MRRICPLSFLYIILILSFFYISCKEKKEDSKPAASSPKSQAAKADAYIVEPRLLSQEIELPGSLIPFEETEIHSEISGRVTGIHFKEGAPVSQGSLLISLSDDDLQAQLKKLYVQLKVAEQTVKRYEELLKISGVSQQEYDLNVLAVNNIKADIHIAKTNIAKTRIMAPYSGKMGLRNISLGAYITPATSIATLRKLNQLKLEFTVPEKYSTRMQPGNYVNFSTETNAGNFPARIIATENTIAADTRSLKVRAVVERNDPSLISGTFARINVPLGDNSAAFMIPSQAIIPRARNKQVILLRNGLAEMQVVTTGFRDSSSVEILSGLKSGDTILISGLLAIKPGTAVSINKISKP